MYVALRQRWGRLLAVALTVALAFSLLNALPSQAQEEPPAAEDAHVLIFTKTAAYRHTEAINQGVPVLETSLADAGITSEHTEDSTIFNDEDLARFDALIMFQASGDPWTADQKAALERYQQGGGGIVAVHNAADMRGGYQWWDDLIGSLMPGHAATGTSPGQPGTVRVEDQTHPSTQHLPQRWDRADEWYNFSTNVRGDAHVLATMDETTYDPGSNAMGYDHPISWCKPYDGGRAWVTAMGHFGAHYTEEPAFVQHIIGGVEWAAGIAEGDCGGTKWDQFERVSLDENTSAPFAIDVAPDGRVFFTELVRGQIRVYDPETRTTDTAITIPVYSGGEDGLLGIALDPNFADNGYLYVYYSPASEDDTDPANFYNRLSRFTVGADSQIDPASESVMLEVPARRLPDEPGHTGGGLEFGPQGNLYLGVGDDVNPHSEPSGGYAPLSEREGTFHDARATSANTNDLRGKLLRITPQPDGSYTIPEGNMFPESEDTQDKTRPEIYAMGFRNPFRFTIDDETGAIGMADYSPDNGTDNPDRGPAGIAEWNLITEPGFYGWPLCMGNNEPFKDVDYTTDPVTVGDSFDCSNPVNDSVRNTGLTNLPAAKPADMWYGYQRSSVPEVIPQGGGLAPMGGPFYNFDPALESDTKFPESYDGKAFFYEWSRNKMYTLIPNGDTTELEKVNPFLPEQEFLAPIDSEFGPEGSMYVLDWGGGFGRDNPNSGLHRIDYVSGSRSPEANITATPDSGHAPLEVSFDGSSSTDPEEEQLTYEWDFTSDGTVDATGTTATHTYDANGVYDARLTVTDPHGKTGTTTVPITVGNTRPEVDFGLPPNGSFFEFGDDIPWDLTVTDAEDESIADADVVVQPALGHNGHAHSGAPLSGRTGTATTSLGGGHGEDMNVFYVLDARYSDSGGEGDIPSLTGSDTTLLFPKKREAEFYDEAQGVTASSSRDVEGHGDAITGSDGAWASYAPVNLYNVDGLTVRAAAPDGGTIELRKGAPDGELLGTAEIPATGPTGYTDVTVPVANTGTDTPDSFTLYAVFPGAGERRLNFVEAEGKGAATTSKPEVAITSPAADDQLEPGAIEVTAEASDEENAVTQVEFFADGESIGVDDTAPYATTWDVTEKRRYDLTAVATNDNGDSTTSRIVRVEVGDLYGNWLTYSNAGATFDRPDTDTWIVNSGGGNMWQGTDEYGAAYLPAAAGEQWTATVRIDGQSGTEDSAKAGLIVRNDVTQPGSSAGYAALVMRAGLEFEWLRDTDGNGELDASDGGGTNGHPAWVRLVRDGDQYTAYWSKDGQEFTAIGDPVTLPGATSAQDIGVAVTAHSSTETNRAQFSGFTLTNEVWTPEPEPDPDPEPGPVCEKGQSDQFDGAELDTSRWSTVRNAEGMPATVADGALTLPVTDGDINEAATGPISYVGQPARDGEWTVETQVSIEHTREWQHAGLLLHGTDDDYVKVAFTRNASGGRLLEFQTESGGSRTWHDNVTLPADFPSTAHLRLSSDGSQLTAAYSADGETWTDLAGAASVIDGATIGLMAAGDTGTPEVDAVFEHFTVTPDTDDDGVRAPSDEFDGDAVDGCRWNSVVRYDSSAVSVADGQLRIQTQPGDINGGANEDPSNFILQDLPAGDWTVETQLTPTMLHQWQLAGLMVYGDDDNYVKFDVAARNTPDTATDLGAELVSEQGGDFGAGGNRQLDVAESTESGKYQLRLTKSGTTYSAEISGDGVNWTSLGEPVTNDAELDSFGLMAIGPQQQEPVTVGFDYFRVTSDGGEDTTAPAVTARQLGEVTGELVKIPGRTDLDVTGEVTMVRSSDNGTAVDVRVEGLDPGSTYPSHLHAGTCAEGGGHYMHDSDGSPEPPNEIWLSSSADPKGELEANSQGVAVGSGSASWVARPVELGVMVHDSEFPGLPIACADLDQGGPQTLELTADDGSGSGVDSIEYRLAGEEPTSYDGPVTFDEPGDYTVEYRATDAAGNAGQWQSLSFTVAPDDTTPPTVDVQVDPAEPTGSNGWHVDPVTVTATAADDGGDVTVEYRVGDGEWTAYDGPVEVADDGVHELAFRGTDEAGNVSEPVSASVRLDATAPEVTVSGVEDGGSYDLGAEVELGAAAEDAVSGVAGVELRLDGEPVDNPSTVTPLAGAHTLTAVGTDEAGNTTEVTVEFTTFVNYELARSLVQQLHDDGLVTTSEANRMLGHLRAAEETAEHRRARQAEAALDRFAAVAEGVADEEVRAQLLAVADALRAQL
ncbi:glucose/arabinose dehydrogenase [Haloactinopolyspora alba]|uniref:Glucose/arabinose dehydrogenase n=1 Tax=Haloactinopolyspora alba TaxID=648780 RepID=A0A2P8EBY1_9ACTN|nr:ThuA domain-containing protein [Haloactinopolyspora alba]PSL06983.1 glucose/arabinose dehydrogenase [Haloactinopolyspora alba]